MENTNGKSLYERLGGNDGILKLVDDIVDAHLKNPAIAQRYVFVKEDPERMAKVKKHTRQFLGAGTGGPENYEGLDMPAAHKGMNISEAEFLHVIDDILLGLDKNNVDAQSKNEVLAIAYSLKDQIVRL
jgi:hemoglobin